MPPAKTEETTITTKIDGVEGVFISKGKVQKELGYKKIENEEAKEVILPDIAEGTYVDADKLEITSHTTKPPAPYTEKTLLRAMETCGKQFKNNEEDSSLKDSEDTELMDAILSGFSIGTPATRAETIKKLITAGYVRMEKKNIRCMPKGRYLIETLPVKELMDLEYTGRLEKTLSDIQKSIVSRHDFMNHIKEFVTHSVREIKTQRVIHTVKNVPEQNKQALSEKGAKDKKKEVKREPLGKCPICGNLIVEGTKGYGCMGYKTGCNYVIWKENTQFNLYKKRLTKRIVKEILSKGEANIAGLTDETGNTFSGIVKNIQNNDTNRYELIITKK
jgi:DNA topoisomerase-3